MAQPTRLLVLQRPDQPLETVCARLREWGCELVLCDSYQAPRRRWLRMAPTSC